MNREMRLRNGNGIASSWSFILCTLLIFLTVEESDGRKITITSEKDFQQNGMQRLSNIMEVDEHNHNQNHMDPELNVFFIPSDLKVGKTMPIFFSNKDSSTSPKFLTKEEADKIPFSPKQLPFLLDFFTISKHSPQAKAMKYTLEQCDFEPMEGETKFCATSLESLFDFAGYLFGTNTQFKVLTTTYLKNSDHPHVPLQNYTISKVNQVLVPNVIGCHPMPYPFAVFYCHSQKGDTSLYEVSIEGENGERVEAAAICHMDTSKWDADHVAFRVLKVLPGNLVSKKKRFFLENLLSVISSLLIT